MKKNENLYMLMSFTANAIFGFSFLFSKLAMNLTKPLVLLACRFTLAFVLMSTLALTKIVKIDLKGKNIQELLVLGLLQPVCYFICESYGIDLTSSSFAGILIALIPIAGIVFVRLFLHESPTLLQSVFAVISVSGVIVLTYGDGLGNVQLIGTLFLLGAVFSGAMFTVQSRKIANQFTAFERTYVMFGLGMLVFDGMAIFSYGFNREIWLTPLTSLNFWISILYLSCVSSIGAFMLLNKSVEGISVTRSQIFASVTTVISVLAGVFFLKEQFTFIQGIGIVLALVGVVGVNRFGKVEND